MKDPNRNIHLSWKDLNIGVELKMFGIVFHLTDCDSFTKVSYKLIIAVKYHVKLYTFVLNRNFFERTASN